MTDAFQKTRNYLKAQELTLSKEISDASIRSQDGRASAHSQREWQNIAMYSRSELDAVRQALAELPPA